MHEEEGGDGESTSTQQFLEKSAEQFFFAFFTFLLKVIDMKWLSNCSEFSPV